MHVTFLKFLSFPCFSLMTDDLFVPPPVHSAHPHTAGSDCSLMSLQHLYIYSTENTDVSFSWVDDTNVHKMLKQINNGNWPSGVTKYLDNKDLRLVHDFLHKKGGMYMKGELRPRLITETKCFSIIKSHLLASKRNSHTPCTEYLPAVFNHLFLFPTECEENVHFPHAEQMDDEVSQNVYD